MQRTVALVVASIFLVVPDAAAAPRPVRDTEPAGPAPRLDPIERFVPPIEPWEPSGFGWGEEAIGEDGEPLCATNGRLSPACDPLGPRPFLHVGFDARPAADRSVRASAAGRVAAARMSFAPFLGRRPAAEGGAVVLEHDLDGDPGTPADRLLTVYLHVDPLVAAGDVVLQGQVIARTSRIAGEHLHFGVRRSAFDPADADLYRTILPPPGTDGCAACFGRPLPLPEFPGRWDEPGRLFSTSDWSRLLKAGNEGGGDVLETFGGYIATGWTTAANIGGTSAADMWIASLDWEGHILSQRAYGGSGTEQVHRLAPTVEGGFVALALTSSFGPRDHAPMLMKFGPGSSDPEWQYVYIASGRDWGFDLKPTSEGGFVMVGATDACVCGGEREATVVKLASNGTVQWAKAFRSFFTGGLTSIDAVSVVETSDGGYVIAGNVFGGVGRTDVLLLRLDRSGNLLWAKTYGREGFEVARQVESTADGGFIVVGHTEESHGAPRRLLLLKIRADGMVDWQATYWTSGWDEGTRIVRTADGGYVVTGRTVAADPLQAKWEVFVLRVDAGGDIIQHRAFDGRGFNFEVAGLRSTRDGGFILSGAGFTDCVVCTPRALLGHFGVLKVNADLQVPGGCMRESSTSRFEWTTSNLNRPLRMRDLAVAVASTDVEIVETAARSHACSEGFFGPPPTIHSVFADVIQEHVACDFTQMLEMSLCSFGIVGARATLPVVLDGTHDSLSLVARITDPDDSPEQTDILDVRADILREGSSRPLHRAELADDGSAEIGFETQRVPSLGEDCFEDPDLGICTCFSARYATYSGDSAPADAVYTRELGIFDHSSSQLLADCAMDVGGRGTLNASGGVVLDLSVQAMDRQGNVSTWPESVTTGFNTLGCSGDACGCCLLLASTSTQGDIFGCAGLQGMPSTEFPCGLCVGLFGGACPP